MAITRRALLKAIAATGAGMVVGSGGYGYLYERHALGITESDVPVNGLIGCFSADGQYLLANVWDQTQELFQGVIVCIHNDPRIGGLKPGEIKQLFGKLYFMKNDPAALLQRYERDFGSRALAPR